MAPTETLAEQHHRTLDSLLGGHAAGRAPHGLDERGAAAASCSTGSATGELQLVVGTHALIEDPVEFRDLAVVVVDEQHRFGVRQRAALDAKAPDGLVPHALHMTATPIPRTLSLTAYGDLDATVLRELPRGRQPVETHVVDGARARARAYERIREEIAAGRQCFVVCPLVEESEALQAKAATVEFERLRTTEFARPARGADPRADAVEGEGRRDGEVRRRRGRRARGDQRDRGGHRRAERHRDADRGGRALRPLAAPPAARPGRPRRARLALHPVRRPDAARGSRRSRDERDGFRLAEMDLELRGAGDVLGTRQHGLPMFKVARLPEDVELLERARDRADEIVIEDPRLEEPEHALLREAVVTRFGSELDPIPA